MTVAGIVLAGGQGRRLGGVDKSGIRVGSVTLRDRAFAALSEACGPVVVVDRAMADAGPLAAVGAGWTALNVTAPAPSAAVVLAVDMPFVPIALLAWLAAGAGSVVPVVADRDQPLCARYERSVLDSTAALVAAGERSMQSLLRSGPVHRAGPAEWAQWAAADDFADIDSPSDLAAALARLGRGAGP